MSEFDLSVMVMVVVVVMVLLNQWILIKLNQHERNKMNRKCVENVVVLTSAPLKAEAGTLSTRLQSLVIIYGKLKVLFLPPEGSNIFPLMQQKHIEND